MSEPTDPRRGLAEAVYACNQVADQFLASRRELLSAGWPVDHDLCEALDAGAYEWAARAEGTRRLAAAPPPDPPSDPQETP